MRCGDGDRDGDGRWDGVRGVGRQKEFAAVDVTGTSKKNATRFI